MFTEDIFYEDVAFKYDYDMQDPENYNISEYTFENFPDTIEVVPPI